MVELCSFCGLASDCKSRSKLIDLTELILELNRPKKFNQCQPWFFFCWVLQVSYSKNVVRLMYDQSFSVNGRLLLE